MSRRCHRGRRSASPRRLRARPRAPRNLERDLGEARAVDPSRARARSVASLPHRPHARGATRARPRPQARGSQSRAPRRLRLSVGARRPGPLAGRPRARRGRRLPRDDRAPCTPERAAGGDRGRRAAQRGEGRAPGRRGCRRRAQGCRPSRPGPPRMAGPAHRPGGRGARAARPWTSEQGDRATPCRDAADGRDPHRAHLCEARRLLTVPARRCSRPGTGSSAASNPAEPAPSKIG